MGKRIINFIASGFYISYLPDFFSKEKGKFRGCGFWGTIVGFLFYPFLPENKIIFLIFLLLFILLSIRISGIAFENETKDNPLIVIDEIAGYFTGAFIVGKNLKNAILIFIFFRIFDTLKPWPIKKLEEIKNKGLAIVIDDIIAGAYSGGITYLINRFFV